MIVDVRTYTFFPGKMPAWVALYEAEAWPLQKKYLGNCLGWYTALEGELHTVVHIWGYESLADRAARRVAMVADPGWKVFMERANALNAFVAQKNTIMSPTGFALPAA